MNRKLLLATLILAGLALACGQAGPTEAFEEEELPPDADEVLDYDELTPFEHVEPVLRPNVTVFPAWEAKEFGITDSHLIVPIEGHEELLDAEPGHVLATDFLFFRKATKVTVEDDVIVFETVDAHLTDAVLQGSFDMKIVGEYRDDGSIKFFDERENPFVRPNGAPATPPEGFGFAQRDLEYKFDKTWDTNIDLVAEAGITFANRWYNLDSAGRLRVMPILKADFKPSLTVQGKVSCCNNFSLSDPFGSLDPKIDYVRVIATGALAAEAGMKVQATAASAGNIDVLVVGQDNALQQVPCLAASASIGILPVSARICPSIRFQGAYKVDGSMDFEAKIAFTKTVGAGLEYSAGNWKKIVRNGASTVTPTVTRQIEFTLDASATLTPKITADISGVLGGEIETTATARLASRCLAPNLSHVLSASWGGKAKAFFDASGIPLIGGLLPRKEKEWTLFQENRQSLWRDDAGQCVPSYATLTYDTVLASPGREPASTRTLDLDMVVSIPGENGAEPARVSHDAALRTHRGANDAYPFTAMVGSNAAGREERVNFTRLLPGTYKIWVSDYENRATPSEGQNAFSRSHARMSMWIGNGQLRSFNAPSGNHNIWNVAQFNVTPNSQGVNTVTITTSNTLRSGDPAVPF